METKPSYLSKTLWVNVVVAVLALAYPPAAQWIQGNESMVLGALAGLNVLLRMITKDKIVLY